jgi:hypothetical protein
MADRLEREDGKIVGDMTLWLPGAYDSKKAQTKMLCIHLHMLCGHEVILRKTTYVAYVKMIKISINEISLFATFFLPFLHSPQKCPFFMKLRVSTQNVYMRICFHNFFEILKFIF